MLMVENRYILYFSYEHLLYDIIRYARIRYISYQLTVRSDGKNPWNRLSVLYLSVESC